MRNLLSFLRVTFLTERSRRLHRHKDRTVKTHATLFELTHDLKRLIKKRERATHFTHNVVAHNDFIVSQGVAQCLAQPRSHHKVGLGIKANQLHLHGAALCSERGDKKLTAHSTAAGHFSDNVNEFFIKVKRGGLRSQKDVFDFFPFPLRHNEHVSA